MALRRSREGSEDVLFVDFNQDASCIIRGLVLSARVAWCSMKFVTSKVGGGVIRKLEFKKYKHRRDADYMASRMLESTDNVPYFPLETDRKNRRHARHTVLLKDAVGLGRLIINGTTAQLSDVLCLMDNETQIRDVLDRTSADKSTTTLQNFKLLRLGTGAVPSPVSLLPFAAVAAAAFRILFIRATCFRLSP